VRREILNISQIEARNSRQTMSVYSWLVFSNRQENEVINIAAHVTH